MGRAGARCKGGGPGPDEVTWDGMSTVDGRGVPRAQRCGGREAAMGVGAMNLPVRGGWLVVRRSSESASWHEEDGPSGECASSEARRRARVAAGQSVATTIASDARMPGRGLLGNTT